MLTPLQEFCRAALARVTWAHRALGFSARPASVFWCLLSLQNVGPQQEAKGQLLVGCQYSGGQFILRADSTKVPGPTLPAPLSLAGSRHLLGKDAPAGCPGPAAAPAARDGWPSVRPWAAESTHPPARRGCFSLSSWFPSTPAWTHSQSNRPARAVPTGPLCRRPRPGVAGLYLFRNSGTLRRSKKWREDSGEECSRPQAQNPSCSGEAAVGQAGAMPTLLAGMGSSGHGRSVGGVGWRSIFSSGKQASAVESFKAEVAREWAGRGG